MSKRRRNSAQVRSIHKVLAHPLRVDVLLRAVLEGKASPSGLAKALGSNVNVVAYHVRVLLKYQALELVETRQRRGATEHFYSVNQGSDVVKVLLGSKLAGIGPLPSGEFTKRLLEQGGPGSTIARTIPVQLDNQGAREVSKVLEGLAGNLRAIEGAALKRLKAAKADPILLNLGVVAFPWAKGLKADGPCSDPDG